MYEKNKCHMKPGLTKMKNCPTRPNIHAKQVANKLGMWSPDVARIMIRTYHRAKMDTFKRHLSDKWETHLSDLFLHLSLPDM